VTLPPFQHVLDEHGAEAYRYLMAAVGAAEADDCYQDTCIAALRAYPRLAHGDALRAWLLRIAERKAIDHRRARARRAVPSDSLPERSSPDGAAPAEPALWEQVRALPDKQRAAVFLRCVLGLPYAELAQALECSNQAARRSVHEGLTKLRKGASTWMTSSAS